MASYFGGSTLRGVQTSHFWQVLFLMAALGLVLHLTAIPESWRTAWNIDVALWSTRNRICLLESLLTFQMRYLLERQV